MKLLPKMLFLFLLFFSCAVGPQLSPMQQRQITTQIINGSYEDTYRASITVLQDQRYVIKNTDMASGLIVANVDRAASGGSQFAQALFLGYVADKGTEIEVSCIVNKISSDQTEVRMNIQEVNYGQSSMWTGTSKQKSKQIYDPEVYRNIFNQIEVEVKRRQAIAGTNIEKNKKEVSINDPEAEQISVESMENSDVSALFPDVHENPVYLDILSTAKNMYLLVHQKKDTPMKLGENYKIVRIETDKTGQVKTIEIGNAKVIKIKEEKVALQYALNQDNIDLTKDIKLKYK